MAAWNKYNTALTGRKIGEQSDYVSKQRSESVLVMRDPKLSLQVCSWRGGGEREYSQYPWYHLGKVFQARFVFKVLLCCPLHPLSQKSLDFEIMVQGANIHLIM